MLLLNLIDMASLYGLSLLCEATDDQTVRLWNATTGAALQTLKGYSSPVSVTVPNVTRPESTSIESTRSRITDYHVTYGPSGDP
jgi:hypothetical protein